MASSLIGGLLGNDAALKTDITVVDVDPAACQRLQDAHGVASSSALKDTAPADGIVIAVKPHIVESVCADIATASVPTQTLVVSVAAGVREASMSAWLPSGMPIVRCMPNTPALLGLGATALYANASCQPTDRALAQVLLDSAGMTRWVEDEALLDAVTALSGSGPAYFFYLIEQMAAAGETLGLPADAARDLAIETAFGAASMARQGDLTPATLRQNVTSKGGTTAAALNVFDAQGMPQLVSQAMQAAHDRAVELGDEFGAEFGASR